ncbi:MAG: Smr/MutS family protein [Nibricoccus sp.]
MCSEEPIRIPITDELDLHTFVPSEIATLLEAYIEACRAKGFRRVRIVHGKGTGTLRETVHAFLRRSPVITKFHLGDETSGSWGATLAYLAPLKNAAEDRSCEDE